MNAYKNFCLDCQNCTEYKNGYWCEKRQCVVYPQVNPTAYRFCLYHNPGVPMKSDDKIAMMLLYDQLGLDPNYQGA